jgi:hypothetical protein
MGSEEAKRIIDTLPKEELILEVQKERRSRFQGDNYAYLKTRLLSLEQQEEAERHEENSTHKQEELRVGRDANELAARANEIAYRAFWCSIAAVVVAVIIPVTIWLLNSNWASPFRFPTPSIASDWQPLVRGSIGTSFDAAVRSDLPEPEIRKFVGNAKFVDDQDQSTNHAVRLGYKITIDVAPLDLSKVPEKYLKEKPLARRAATIVSSLTIDKCVNCEAE